MLPWQTQGVITKMISYVDSQSSWWRYGKNIRYIDQYMYLYCNHTGVMRAGKIQRWKQQCYSLCWKLPDRAQSHTCQLSQIIPESPGYDDNLPSPVQVTKFPDKIHLWAFLCSNLKFIPFFPKFYMCFTDKDLFRHYNHKSELWWSVTHLRLHIMS